MKMMYVRYFGTRVCWTLPDERFYVGDREELTEDERKVCETGGGEMPSSDEINLLASHEGSARINQG